MKFVAYPSEVDPPSMADAPFHCPPDITYKSPAQRLNEILLQAAIRAENRNADRHADELARQVAKLNDELAGEK